MTCALPLLPHDSAESTHALPPLISEPPDTLLSPEHLAPARSVVAALTARAQHAVEALGAAHAAALAFDVAPQPPFRLVARNANRREHGVFYTPLDVARRVVRDALDALRGDVREIDGFPTILDPAMGTGVFLLAAVQALRERIQDAPASVLAERCLHGLDLDPLAAGLAVIGISLDTGADPHVLSRHLRAGDALSQCRLPPCDLVIGNPPWGVRIPDSDRRQHSDTWGLASGSFDSFKPFVARAAATTRGALGMVLPQAVLLQEQHADIRHVLLSHLAPYSAVDYGNGPFRGAAAPACSLVFGPRPGPRTVRCVARIGNMERETRVAADDWSSRGGFRLRPLHSYLRRRGHLSRLGDLAPAFRVRDTGINYNTAAVARKVFYSDPVARSPLDIARYRGRDFTRYSPVGRSGWVDVRAAANLEPGESLSLSLSTFGIPEKIVLRQTADRPIGTLDRTRTAMGRSVIAVTAEPDVSLPALLACLNSGLLAEIYGSLAAEEGRVLPQVKVSRLHALPVPAVAPHPIPAALHRAAARISRWDDLPIDELRVHPPLSWAVLHHLALHLLDAGGTDVGTDGRIETVVGVLYTVDGQSTIEDCVASAAGVGA